MKVVFVGGGSHRYLSVARSILAEPGLMENGEISVFDLAVDRAEAMRSMIAQCPEKRNVDCAVESPFELDAALEGADVVIVVLFAGNRRNFLLSQRICGQHGFIGSDQLSPSGAMLAMKGAPILLNIAKRMEELCPDAFLLDFANPVAVLSAAVNNHTKINCMGICAGYTNHMWDIARILGKDECCSDHAVNCAGVNHMSFILKDPTGWMLAGSLGSRRVRLGETEVTVASPKGQAMRRIPMTMKDWAGRLDAFLEFNERNILEHAGRISHEMAKELAESEYDRLHRERVRRQDRQPSDFDRAILDKAEELKKITGPKKRRKKP